MIYQKLSINSAGVREDLGKPLAISECRVSLRVNSHDCAHQGICFSSYSILHGMVLDCTGRCAWFWYLSSDKYAYVGPFSIAFHSICNSTELPVFCFFSDVRHITLCASCAFRSLYAVEENGDYALFIGALSY